jgi:hypothetical protein
MEADRSNIESSIYVNSKGTEGPTGDTEFAADERIEVSRDP